LHPVAVAVEASSGHQIQAGEIGNNMARVTVQGKTASNSLVDLLVNEDGSLSGGGSGGATASEIGNDLRGGAPLPTSLSPASGTTLVLANAATATGAQAAVDVPKAFVDFTFLLTGTGAISCTVDIEKSDGTNWFTAATMVLSGTTSVKDTDWFDNVMGQLRANITAISGTGAALTVRARY
jgi:hypothetical protein